MADIGTITAKLVADAVGFTNPLANAQKQLSELNKEAGNTGKQMGGFGSILGKAGLALGAIGAAAGAVMVIKDIGMKAIQTASEVEEMENQFAVSFGKGADSARTFAETAAEAMGRSIYDIERFMASTQAMLVPMLGSQEAAQGLSETFAVLATDLASFYNTQDADALRALQAGIVGEGEALKRYGVILNQATLEEEAHRQGIKKKITELTEQEKVLLRAASIFRQTAQAQGDAAKTQDSYTNSMKKLQAAQTDLYVALGKELIPAMAGLVRWLTDATKWLNDFIKRAKEFKAPEWMKSIGSWVKDTAKWWESLGDPKPSKNLGQAQKTTKKAADAASSAAKKIAKDTKTMTDAYTKGMQAVQGMTQELGKNSQAAGKAAGSVQKLADNQKKASAQAKVLAEENARLFKLVSGTGLTLDPKLIKTAGQSVEAVKDLNEVLLDHAATENQLSRQSFIDKVLGKYNELDDVTKRFDLLKETLTALMAAGEKPDSQAFQKKLKELLTLQAEVDRLTKAEAEQARQAEKVRKQYEKATVVADRQTALRNTRRAAEVMKQYEQATVRADQQTVLRNVEKAAEVRAQYEKATQESEKRLWKQLLMMKIGNWFKEQTQASSQVVESTIAGFADSIQLLTNPMGWLALLLEAVAPLLDALIMPLKDLFGILANAIAPIFKALYPIISGFAIAVVTVSKAVVDFVIGIITVLSKLPIIGGMFDGILGLLGQVSAALGEGINALKDAEFGASALDNLSKNAEKAADSLLNVPASLRIATRRGQAAAGTVGMLPPGFNPAAMGSGGSVIVLYNQNGPVYGMDDFKTQVKGIVSSSISRQRLQQYGTSGSVVTALG
jgi:chemotaxis protein histidine kinase CheA